MEIVINLAFLAALTTAGTEVVKQTLGLKDRFLAGTAIVLGVGFAMVFVGVSREAALMGLLAAFMASGLWEQGRTWAGTK